MVDENGKICYKAKKLPSPPTSSVRNIAEAAIWSGSKKRNAVLLLATSIVIMSLHRSNFMNYSPTDNGDDQKPVSSDWIVPLMMSTAAGMSTCLGAATVFLASERMGHKHLAFALSMAASVMITVSFASILPEAFKDSRPDAEHKYIQFGAPEFFQRCLAFSVGSALYIFISRFAFPDPEDILDLQGTKADQKKQKSPYSADKEGSIVDKHDALMVRRMRESLYTSPVNSYRRDALDMPLPLLHSALSPPLGVGAGCFDRTSSSETAASCFANFTRGSDLETNEARRAWRLAMLLFVSLAVHNFPEVNFLIGTVALKKLVYPRLAIIKPLVSWPNDCLFA